MRISSSQYKSAVSQCIDCAPHQRWFGFGEQAHQALTSFMYLRLHGKAKEDRVAGAILCQFVGSSMSGGYRIGQGWSTFIFLFCFGEGNSKFVSRRMRRTE